MIEKDERFTLAERYVEETGVSVFLTGKAGTRKTTFLKEIIRQTSKRFAVVAPTGVAAIKQSLYDSGAVYASMSGSGSALFALYKK